MGLDREPPEHRPPDDVVEQADPAEGPGKRTGQGAVEESQGTESLAGESDPDDAAVSLRFPREEVVAVREHADHHADDLHERQRTGGGHARYSKQRGGEQNDRGAPHGVVDGGRVEPAPILPELVAHAGAGLALAIRSRTPDVKTPAASTSSIQAGKPW